VNGARPFHRAFHRAHARRSKGFRRFFFHSIAQQCSRHLELIGRAANRKAIRGEHAGFCSRLLARAPAVSGAERLLLPGRCAKMGSRPSLINPASALYLVPSACTPKSIACHRPCMQDPAPSKSAARSIRQTREKVECKQKVMTAERTVYSIRAPSRSEIGTGNGVYHTCSWTPTVQAVGPTPALA
jgi:hypothetical protein